jgi:opacity protein-like surface antigen
MSSRRVLVVLLATLPLGVRAQEPPATPAPATTPAVAEGAPPSPHRAAPPPSDDDYLGFRLGVAIPRHSDLKGMGNGISGELFLGTRLKSYLAFEGGVGRYSLGGSLTQYPYGGAVTTKTEIVVIPITATVKAIMQIGVIELYGAAGGGVDLVEASTKQSGSGGGSATVSWKDQVFEVHVGGGVQGRLTHKLLFGVDLKYGVASADIQYLTINIDTLLVTASLVLDY